MKAGARVSWYYEPDEHEPECACPWCDPDGPEADRVYSPDWSGMIR